MNPIKFHEIIDVRPYYTFVGTITIENLNVLAGKIEKFLKEGKTILVHCAMGQERAPLVVAWYLSKYRNMTLNKAYNLISKKRPSIRDVRNRITS